LHAAVDDVAPSVMTTARLRRILRFTGVLP
jgi:hypothetical protein